MLCLFLGMFIGHWVTRHRERRITQERARLIAAAPRMLALLRRLRDGILASNPIEFDNWQQQAGFDAAARSIGLLRVTELLAELEGEGVQ